MRGHEVRKLANQKHKDPYLEYTYFGFKLTRINTTFTVANQQLMVIRQSMLYTKYGKTLIFTAYDQNLHVRSLIV